MVRIKWNCYSNDGVEAPVPKRLSLLRADAAAAIPPYMRGTDFYRSANQQITALRTRRGAQWPGYSGHGEGRSIDFDVELSMKVGGFKRKKDMDNENITFGWVNHLLTRDGRGFEEWHNNYLPEIALGVYNGRSYGTRSLDELEAQIKLDHKDEWELLHPLNMDATKKFTGDECKPLQWCLSKAGFYDGEIDGLWGKHSISAFLHATAMWGAKNHNTRRVLGFITAGVQVIGETPAPGVIEYYAEAEPFRG